MLRTWLVAFAFVSGAASALYALLPDDREEVVRRRVRQVALPSAPADTLEVANLRRPLTERVLAPALRHLQGVLARIAPDRMRERLEVLLREAGLPPRVESLLTTKFLAAAVGFASAAALFRSRGQAAALALGAVAAAALWLLPDARLRRLAAARRRAVERVLPEVLDLLCISVEAGLGFDGAVQKVAEKFAGPVAAEFSLYLREVALGRPREEALRAMAARVRVPDLQALVAVIIQADRLGVSLARVLRVQAEDLRVRRRQRAEERAMQIPVKLLFPLVFFIFPAVFAVLLGPAVLHIVALWRGV
jgi:tight adherence protein C